MPVRAPVAAGSRKRMRGPWDSSSSIELHVDVDSLLAVPKPVVVC